jgi:hypothetical protein
MTPWKETYHGEAADVFERKIKLLVEYQFIEPHEEIVLQSVLQALRDIAESAEIQGGTVPDRDGEAWSRLYDSIRPHATNEDIQAFRIRNDMDGTIQSPGRTHRFIVEGTWDPYDLWFRYELQKPRVRDLYCHTWTSYPHFRLYRAIKTGKFLDIEWNSIVESRRVEISLPAWYDTTYGEFVAAVERLWEKNDSEEKKNVWLDVYPWLFEGSSPDFDEYLDETPW